MCAHRIHTNSTAVSLSSPGASTEISEFSVCWNTEFLDTSTNDWLNYLQHHNKRNNRSSLLDKILPSNYVYFESPSVADTIFEWCNQLKLSDNVMYRTLELYNDFCAVFSNHLSQKYPMSVPGAVDKCRALKSPTTYWKDYLTEINHQSILHLVSCLQIASKLEDNYKVVTINHAAQLLHEAQQSCLPPTILDSEVLVLVTLQHCVNIPPISEYVEMLLCHLTLQQQKKASQDQEARHILCLIDAVHQLCHQLLRVILFSRNFIVEKIACHCNDNGQQEYGADIRAVDGDKMLLSAGTIIAAFYLIDPEVTTIVMKYFNEHFKIHPNTSSSVSSVLITYLEENTEL